MTELLQLCDVVRDDTLPELGVRLEDHEGNRAENLNVLSSKTKISTIYLSNYNVSFVCYSFIFMLVTSVFCTRLG